MTTPLTMSLDKYKSLLSLTNGNIFTIGMKNFAKNIENYYLSPTTNNKIKLLKDVCFVYKNAKNYDCIVLGCTHFIFAKPFFYQLSNIPLIDGNVGIANNLIKYLHDFNIKPTKKYKIKILLSDKNQTLAKKYKKILCQTLAK